MKTLAMMLGLALACLSAPPARAIEVVTGAASVQPYPHLAPLASNPSAQYALLPHLPEPEVVAMMLLGLVLIGYRASRDSSEKFR